LTANRLLNHAKFTKESPNMTEEMPSQGLPTATGFAAREVLAALRRHNIATAPLLLRAGLSEHVLERGTEESNRLPQRVSAIGQCKFLEYAAEAMDDSAFGLHLARQIDPRDVGLYFYAGSAARDLGEALALFSRYCRIVNEAFRLTQRSADTTIEFEFVGLPRYVARHNMEYVVAGIRTALRTITGRNVVPAKVAFAHNRNSDVREFERFFGCPVEFGAPSNLLSISGDALCLPLITADPKLLRVLAPQLSDARIDALEPRVGHREKNGADDEHRTIGGQTSVMSALGTARPVRRTAPRCKANAPSRSRHVTMTRLALPAVRVT